MKKPQDLFLSIKIMLPQTEIDKYGGKAAILNHIRDNTDLPIPPYEVMQAG